MTSDSQRDHLWSRHCEPEDCTVEAIPSSHVEGTIPEWVSGVLYRVGPGVQQYGEDRYKHAFDGNGILHAFELRNGDNETQPLP